MKSTEDVGFGLFKPRRRASGSWHALVALLAGGLQACSLSWPWGMPHIISDLGLQRGAGQWWLQILALSVLHGLLRGAASTRQAAWLGWWFSLAWLAGTIAWLYTSMHRFGGLSAPVAMLAVLALAAGLALYYAGAAACYRHFEGSHAVTNAGLFASLWLLAEMGRGVLLTGFGWGAIGYAHLSGPLSPWIAWIGLYGVSALAAMAAALLSQSWERATHVSPGRNRLKSALVLAALVLTGLVLPQTSGSNTGALDVTLLQGNIDQDAKFDNSQGVPKSLNWYAEQLQANESALVITPETALPVLPGQLPEGYWARLQARYAKGEQAALIGMPMGSLAQGYSNAVIGLKPGQSQPWRYDKQHLVPFGEFIPPLFRWFTNLMAIPLGDFQRGSLVQPTFDWQGQRLAASVCYENLFSEEMAAQFRQASTAPTVLFNVSNLAWFGEHLAMEQHLNIARMRALEFDRPFLLATNTGITAIVDHRGQVLQRAPAHQAVALRGLVEGRAGLTPYATWMARWGLWPLVLLALAMVLGLSRLRRR